MKKLLRHNVFAIGALALGAAVFAIFLSRISVFEALEYKTIDSRFRIRGRVPMVDTSVVIVAIDDESFASVPSKWPYPRTYYAKAVDNLMEAGAKLIIFDVEFTEASEASADDDLVFADAVKRSGSVILAAKIVYDQGPHGIYSSYLLKPIDPLLNADSYLGLVNYDHDIDGFLRQYLLFNRTQKKTYFSLAVRAMQLLQDVSPESVYVDDQNILTIGTKKIRKLGFNSMLVNFRGPARTIPTYSLSSVLDDADFDLIGDADTDYMELFKESAADDELAALIGESPFKNKIVFIGAAAEELGDNKLTPFFHFDGRREKMPGVEVHASALSTILDDDYLTFMPVGWALLIIFLLSLLSAVVGRVLRPILALGIVATVILLYFIVGLWAFISHNFLLQVIGPSLGIIISYVGNIVHVAITERREKRFYRQTFQQYVARSVVDKMLDSGERPKFGGERKELTVLFSDIRSFSHYAERNEPEHVVTHLSDYLTKMVHVIFQYNGTLDKFVGDEIMAVYGAPYHYENHAERACRSAVDMVNELDKLNKEEAKRDHQFRIGVGINTGQMIVGNLGSEQLFDYTVIGDEVNLGARLEGANKLYHTTIIMSEMTYQLVKDTAIARELDIVRVVGKEKPVRLYELLSMDHISDEKKEMLIQVFGKGLAAYREQKWAPAVKQFRRILRTFPDDGPSKLYIKRCLDFIENPPPDDWDGIYTFSVK